MSFALELAGALYLVDVGSLAGVYRRTSEGSLERIRCLRLDEGCRLTLGYGVIELSWRPLTIQ
ncbi:MAG: hypothetical protein AAGF12_31930 [Myxococcota bacterium]